MALRCLTRLKLNQQIIQKTFLPLSCAGHRNFALTHDKCQLLPRNISNQFQLIRTRYDKSGKSSSEQRDDDDVSWQFNLIKNYPIYNKSSHSFQSDDEGFANDQEKKNIVKYSMQSMRTDLIIKQALNIARNKIEVAFYEGKIRVNGKKIQKKSHTARVGDEIDLVKGESPTNPDHLVISRIEILSAVAKEESIAVTMKRYKQMLVDKYKNY